MDNEDDKPIATSRSRSRPFSKKETDDLINLVHKYRRILLNKSLCAWVSQAKDACWIKITKLFNAMNREQVRTTENLRTRWDNIKKEARKLSNNVIDLKDNSPSSLDIKIFTMLNDAENADYIDTGDISDEEMGSDNEKAEVDIENNDEDEELSNGDDNENEDKLAKHNRVTYSSIFSVKECTLLLQLMRQEKDILFSRDRSYSVSKLKTEAWARITDSYNKLSPRKRSTKVLMKKFRNMKSLVKRVGFKEIKNNLGIKRNKHEKLVENKTVIKKEPDFIYDMHENCDWNANDENQQHSPETNVGNLQGASDNSDPLCTVLNSDSGLGSCHLGSNYDAEVVKLKMELLNYQMDTAKLERKRVEDAIAAEAKARESLEIEQAMRLRSARLEAVAAAMRLPPAHPALSYTAEELRAHAYITQYRLQDL